MLVISGAALYNEERIWATCTNSGKKLKNFGVFCSLLLRGTIYSSVLKGQIAHIILCLSEDSLHDGNVALLHDFSGE